MVFAATPLDHVLDTRHWHLFESIDLGFKLPFGITKFVVLQLIAAGIICFLYIRLANRVKDGTPPKGWGWNALESVLTFFRNEVAKPTLGDHDADKFLPFIWTMFLYILVNNLLGTIPFMGSPTGSILVTGGLALCAFAVIHGAAVARHGPVGYLKSYVPHIDAPGGKFIAFGIAGMEIIGHFIKTFVLAVRLFANIFAGHTVLAVILSFIYIAGHGQLSTLLFAPISLGSVLFIVALSLLEIFVAFLQAYVFTYLMSLFLGMTLHPEH
jgi:F-type H+-transporting ATPase subunit a